MKAITKEQIVDYLMHIKNDPALSQTTNPREDMDANSCLYQDGHGNHCLVGHWLNHWIGVDDEWMENNIESKAADQAIQEARDHGLIDFIEQGAIDLLLAAQATADHWTENEESGELIFATWGEAIDNIDFDA